MNEKLIKAIMDALRAGMVVELFRKPDGTIKARTVRKKELKT